MKIQAIRHATFILHINDKKILVDPVLSPKGVMTAIEKVPNQNSNPLTDLPIPVESLLHCDAVLVTHTHRDHFDDAAAKLIPKSMPIFCQPEDEEKIGKHGFTCVMPVKESLKIGDIKIDRTKGRHGHGILALKMAPVSGFVFSAPGEPVLYITGDTVWCSHVEKALDRYAPKVVVSFCGEARFSWGRPITMNVRDILSICKRSPAAKVVAVHMEAWNHCRLSREALREFTASHGMKDRVFVPEDGEPLDFFITD